MKILQVEKTSKVSKMNHSNLKGSYTGKIKYLNFAIA
jgi:hypothetical protein